MQLALLPDGLDGKLIHVEEECSEVLQEICKLRRFGPNNSHPREPEKGTNRERLLNECAQLEAAILRLRQELTQEVKCICDETAQGRMAHPLCTAYHTTSACGVKRLP